MMWMGQEWGVEGQGKRRRRRRGIEMIVRELTSMPLRHGAKGNLLKRQTGARLAQLHCARLWQWPVRHVLSAVCM